MNEPQFSLFQAVDVLWFSEEKNTLTTDRGVIVGLVRKLPELLKPGWWYLVQYSEIQDCDWLPADHADWVHESELRPSTLPPHAPHV